MEYVNDHYNKKFIVKINWRINSKNSLFIQIFCDYCAYLVCSVVIWQTDCCCCLVSPMCSFRQLNELCQPLENLYSNHLLKCAVVMLCIYNAVMCTYICINSSAISWDLNFFLCQVAVRVIIIRNWCLIPCILLCVRRPLTLRLVKIYIYVRNTY